MKEIPIESCFSAQIDISGLEGQLSERRFNNYGEHLCEEKLGTPQYDAALFGEYILKPRDHGHRIDEIRIRYRRVMERMPCYCT